MSRVDPKLLEKLQSKPLNVRNFCILAHVDHGKTTLSDSLVSSNGLISERLAGQMRYLDSTEEEQKRGITMHSSAISLMYTMESKNTTSIDNNNNNNNDIDILPLLEDYLINLVDSPGHIDFSSDVSTATRLSDGALIVVDVVEGVCTQTHAVLFKALRERMIPCLVLNKMDRLILELCLSPVEAFHHLRRIIEHVNAIAYQLVASEITLDNNKTNSNSKNSNNNSSSRGGSGNGRWLEEVWNFDPVKGNVVFASAYDTWGFALARFCNIWSRKLGVSKKLLMNHIWGDYYYNSTTKKVHVCDPRKIQNHKPMFAALVLEPIWSLYRASVTDSNPTKCIKMIQKLGVQLPTSMTQPSRTRLDERSTVRVCLHAWLPLSESVLRMVVRTLPDPMASQQRRYNLLLHPDYHKLCDNSSIMDSNTTSTTTIINTTTTTTEVKDAVLAVKSCDSSSSAPVVIFISKMMSIRVAELTPADKKTVLTQSHLHSSSSASVDGAFDDTDSFYQETELAVGRIFSGCVTRESQLYVVSGRQEMNLGTLADINNSTTSTSDSCSNGRVALTNLGIYLCLGPSVFPVEVAHAGSIIGIIGLTQHVFKTATLCSNPSFLPFADMTYQATPMLKVAVEPKSHHHLSKVERGLERLYRFDPAVEIGVGSTGELTMTCLGELHLDQCVKALVDRFAQCEISVSEPLVSFRETLLYQPTTKTNTVNNNCSGGNLLNDISDSNTNDITTIPNTPVLNDDTNTVPRYLPAPWCDMLVSQSHRVQKQRVYIRGANGAVQVRLTACGMSKRAISTISDAVSYTSEEQDEKDKEGGEEGEEGKIDTSSDLRVKQAQIQRLRSLLEHSSSTSSSNMDINENENNYTNTNTNSNSNCNNNDICERLRRSLTNEWYMTSDIQKDLTQIERTGSFDRLLSVSCTGGNLLLLAPNAQVAVWSRDVPIFPINNHANYNTNNDDNNDDNDDDGESTKQQGHTTNQVESSEMELSPILGHQVQTLLSPVLRAAFDMVCSNGPLAGEALQGIVFLVERVDISRASLDANINKNVNANKTVKTGESNHHEDAGPMLHTGSFISEMLSGLRALLLSNERLRLVEPFYACSLQCDASQLGNLYSVLNRRRGRVVSEDVIEGTSLFIMHCKLPVVESFGFATELLKKTSGEGTAPLLLFSHWEVIEEDAFWRPTTEEEQEDHGDLSVFNVAGFSNKARGLVDKIRIGKRMLVESLVVASAEKQRTLKR